MYSSSLPESYIFYPAFFFILSLALTLADSEGKDLTDLDDVKDLPK